MNIEHWALGRDDVLQHLPTEPLWRFRTALNRGTRFLSSSSRLSLAVWNTSPSITGIHCTRVTSHFQI